MLHKRSNAKDDDDDLLGKSLVARGATEESMVQEARSVALGLESSCLRYHTETAGYQVIVEGYDR